MRNCEVDRGRPHSQPPLYSVVNNQVLKARFNAPGRLSNALAQHTTSPNEQVSQ